jgi:uncharacterized protein (TIGR03437 family)
MPRVLTCAISFCSAILLAQAAPTISVSGGMQVGTATIPLVFTWNSTLPIQGSGWTPGESVAISLQGPLNMPGVAATTLALGNVSAGSGGTFSASPAIPYDQGVIGAAARIPRPGLYALQATGTTSGAVTSAYRINLAPAAYTGAGGIDWSHERGTRPGVLPGAFAVYSPERSDPEWISVWDNRPVEIYATVSGAVSDPGEQRARISFEDDPLAHYAHDLNAFLDPDPGYRWTLGTSNYFLNPSESAEETGRIELEWETLNAGNTQTYGSGKIGVPVWANPTLGDRVYGVGRWVLDAGHPEIGDRTEIHPARLLATMRQRPALSNGVAASQVDIYVSGHGGGANMYPSGMDALLSQGGWGGGRMRDVLSATDQQTYFQPGPLSASQLPLVNLLLIAATGAALSNPIFPTAGPSAFPWGTLAPEEQPVNDMDYDFDVPLPAPPASASSVRVEVVTHAEHTTAVTEAITYPAANGALPTAAHVHLPYRGADNGIYARTLKFAWNTAAAPQHQFRVHLNSVTVKALPGEWHLWSDVSGQWTNLSSVAPALLQSTQGQTIATAGAQFDVYLKSSDSLRVLVQGYAAQCVDRLFGTLFGKTSYTAGIQLLTTCGPVNNTDLGGALLELPALPSSAGNYTATGDTFQVSISVEYVNTVQVPSECAGRGPLSPSISSGGVVGAGLSVPAVARVSPGGLISLFGQNFAPAGTSRSVSAADLQNGLVPANLACTCVAVNQHLAPVLFVSPAQINIQAPTFPGDDTAVVQAIANCGATGQQPTTAQSVPAQPAAPQFFFFTVNSSGGGPIAAEDALTGARIGAAGLLQGATFTPAKPGEYVALYATGLGATAPVFAPGMLANQAAPAASPVTVSVNGAPLAPGDILYAGAAPGYAGLYQINIRIPSDSPDGDLPISLTIGGATTPAGAFLTVHK